MFKVGEAASLGVQEIAENGNLAELEAALAGDVFDLVIAAGTPPPILPGASRSFTITADRRAKFFSFVSMLICTNDGFTGLAGVRLPRDDDDASVHKLVAYDAGTEDNTEDLDDMVPPCDPLTGGSEGSGTGTTNPTLAENGVIHMHGGIQGIGDLDLNLHGWTDPVATVSIRRLDDDGDDDDDGDGDDDGDDGDVETEVDLDGSQEVPSVVTNMTGEVEVEIEDGKLEFELEVSNNTHDIFAAHIHCATPGANGPVGITLFSGSFTAASGTLAKGRIRAPNAGNKCGWAEISAVAAAIRSGNTYVNVHTTSASGGVPSGEIRGNLPGSDDDDD